MKKVSEKREIDHSHLDVITGHLKTSAENAERNKRPQQQPLSELIAKFHRIKEERFKPKHHHFFPIERHDPQIRSESVSFETHLPPKLESLLERRPQSASGKAQGDSINVARGRPGGRRMSLPSIFHPLTPLPVKTESPETIEREEEVVAYPVRRRHSVSHVMTEYSKHNLQRLSKIQEMEINHLNDINTPRKEKDKRKPKAKKEEVAPPWLTGDDLHAFYNMWEKPGKANWKKRLHIRKVQPRTGATTHNKDGDDDQHRPRVFSF